MVEVVVVTFDRWNPHCGIHALGRRMFLTRVGAATVGTAIALHGFSTEVLASSSTDCPYQSVVVGSAQKYFKSLEVTSADLENWKAANATDLQVLKASKSIVDIQAA